MVAAVQETKMRGIDDYVVRSLWGNNQFDFALVDSNGASGGILVVWDSKKFIRSHTISDENFLCVDGVWSNTNTKVMFVSVYFPQLFRRKKEVWRNLLHIFESTTSHLVVMGDFNAVREERERFGSVFNALEAREFNNFIHEASLIDLPLGGSSFTWSSRDGMKRSKLDRFLISDGILDSFSNISASILEKGIPDHQPVLLCENVADYGAYPFRVFHSWFEIDGIDELIVKSWGEPVTHNENAMVRFKLKLQRLKNVLKDWNKERRLKAAESKNRLKMDISSIDQKILEGVVGEEEINTRLSLIKQLRDLEHLEDMDISQKARIKWGVEGDENSKYFHASLNRKRRQMAIKGIMKEGGWEMEPGIVKQEFLNHFQTRFAREKGIRIPVVSNNFKVLSVEQIQDLDDVFSQDEIKRAVWDCGSDKAPGPDGFTFGFMKRYWEVVKDDVFNLVLEFQANKAIPKGCNPSFIALIPKIGDPKYTCDFRPISLIGCQYKIIGKLLANRLAMVIDSVVSSEQSAFIKGRQILDGPLILSEVLAHYKNCKKSLMIFKVDFEKAYDSLSWEYLLEVMRKMGFSDVWCAWIRAALQSSRASVLVNGSPTTEFEVQRGLRQGDPLSPFLFVIAMEGLHVGMMEASRVGAFNGVKIGKTDLEISHLLYADDAVIICDWSVQNARKILNILQVFYLASGLKINLVKRKLIGVGVQFNTVSEVAQLLGCSAVQTPFMYLGVMVGGNMNRIDLWKTMMDRFVERLARWKVKLLSMGGRLTLVKAVLGSISIYHMSIYKVPLTVLKRLEALRARFFLGC